MSNHRNLKRPGTANRADPETCVQLFLRKRKRIVAEQTLYNNKGHLNVFTRWCENRGVTDLGDLDGHDFLEYQFYLEDERELKPITVGNHFNTLRVFFKFLETYDYIPQEGHVATQLESPEFGKGQEAKTTMLEPDAVKGIFDHLTKFEYARRRHILFAILWHTGARLGAVRGLDLDDYTPPSETAEDEPYGTIEFYHRPETGTPLKNGDIGTTHPDGGEREVFIHPDYCEIIDDYIRINRPNVEDEYGRKPLLTTENGRASMTALRMQIYTLTRPCEYTGSCPVGEDPETCAYTDYMESSKCPESVSPHPIRRSSITYHLKHEGWSYEDASEKFNVGIDILKRHYDQTKKKDRRRLRAKRYFTDDADFF